MIECLINTQQPPFSSDICPRTLSVPTSEIELFHGNCEEKQIMSKDKYLRIKWRLSCRYPPNIFRNTGSFENRAQAKIFDDTFNFIMYVSTIQTLGTASPY